MGLKNLPIPRQNVELPTGGSFAVRGLSYFDLKVLLTKHSVQLSNTFDLLVGSRDDNDGSNTAMMVALFLEQAPAIAADVICIAADEPDAFETVLMLPFPVQTDALNKIAKMTFASEDDVKKFIAIAKNLMSGFQSNQET